MESSGLPTESSLGAADLTLQARGRVGEVVQRRGREKPQSLIGTGEILQSAVLRLQEKIKARDAIIPSLFFFTISKETPSPNLIK